MSIIEGPWPKPANVLPLSRRTSMDIGNLAGSFGDAFDVALGRGGKSPDAGDMIRLSEALDMLALRARKYGYALSKPTLLVLAQDIESISERVMHMATELGEIP